MKNRWLEIVSDFRIFPEICFSSKGTFFKTQSKLTHFIKSMFQKHEIVGASHLAIYPWTLWSSVILDIGLNVRNI